MTEVDEVKAMVVTADQIDSRRLGDDVPTMLEALSDLPSGTGSRAFARTAGDEIQALFADPTQLVSAVELLVRTGGWRIGVGLGGVQTPVPDDVRAATGTAFVNARTALAAARSAPHDLSAAGPGADEVKAVLWLLAPVWQRRSDAGWEVVTLARSGMQQQDIATRLHISPSAVSQRLRTALHTEVEAGARLAADLIARSSEASAVTGRG